MSDSVFPRGPGPGLKGLRRPDRTAGLLAAGQIGVSAPPPEPGGARPRRRARDRVPGANKEEKESIPERCVHTTSSHSGTPAEPWRNVGPRSPGSLASAFASFDKKQNACFIVQFWIPDALDDVLRRCPWLCHLRRCSRRCQHSGCNACHATANP